MLSWDTLLELYSPNNSLPKEKLTSGSGLKFIWVCDKGHEWEQPLRNVLNSNGCQVCSGRKILAGYNDLALIHPELAVQWHPTKNIKDINDYSFGSSSQVWWRCSKEHEWKDSVSHRVNEGRGCPVCSNRKIVPGTNDLATRYPEVSSQWHPTKNGSLSPSQIGAGSTKKVWWVDALGHEWQVSPDSRTSKTVTSGCPICAGKKVLSGFNDLETVSPKTLKFWDFRKNSFLPSEVSAGSGKVINWVCDKGHEWKRTALKQVSTQTCPICLNKIIVPGINDLHTTHPTIAAQWSAAKNKTLPSRYSFGSETKVWWQCENGHEWEANINNRTKTKRGTGCPKCHSQQLSSKAEVELAGYIESLGLKIIRNDRTILKQKELDIYVPDKMIAFEYNGVYWHAEARGKDKNYHYNKWREAKEAGVQLIQIWEDDWIKNRPLIEEMVAYKLGLSAVKSDQKVQARTTSVQPITKSEAEAFLAKNHIQGFSHGFAYLALKTKGDETVAVLVLRKEPSGDDLNIVRYATSMVVPGGFTKLLKHAERTFKPKSFVTFADHCVSDGKLYENNGFISEKEIPPDYMYVVDSSRKHKFGFRLKRFKNDPLLEYREGLTEQQLANLNGLPRVWDAGKTRYRKIVEAE